MGDIANKDQESLATLQNSIADIPGARIDDLLQGNENVGRPRPAVIIRTTIGDRTENFVAETRGNLYPRDAHEAISQIKLCQSIPAGREGCLLRSERFPIHQNRRRVHFD